MTWYWPIWRSILPEMVDQVVGLTPVHCLQGSLCYSWKMSNKIAQLEESDQKVFYNKFWETMKNKKKMALQKDIIRREYQRIDVKVLYRRRESDHLKYIAFTIPLNATYLVCRKSHKVNIKSQNNPKSVYMSFQFIIAMFNI